MNKNRIRIAKFFYLAVLCSSLVISTKSLCQNYSFSGGSWYIKGKFKNVTVYSINGVFSFIKPDKIDSTIDLKGKFCIPPFGDAHTHNLDGGFNLKEMVTKYLKEGVFYVQVLGNNGEGSKAVRPALEKSKKIGM